MQSGAKMDTWSRAAKSRVHSIISNICITRSHGVMQCAGIYSVILECEQPWKVEVSYYLCLSFTLAPACTCIINSVSCKILTATISTSPPKTRTHPSNKISTLPHSASLPNSNSMCVATTTPPLRTPTLPEAESLRTAWKTELQEGHEVIEGHRGAGSGRGAAGWLSEGHLEGWRGREKIGEGCSTKHDRKAKAGDKNTGILEGVARCGIECAEMMSRHVVDDIYSRLVCDWIRMLCFLMPKTYF